MKLPRAVKTSHLIGVGAIWAASLAYGFWIVRQYESTPGAAAQSPQMWPAVSRISRQEHSARLLMFVHPECSCTRASLEELAKMLNQMPAVVAVSIVIEAEAAASVRSHALDAEIDRLPRVEKIYDPQGAESRRFGALTSGHTVLYDATGRLQFSGGITGARGHVGDNFGLRRLMTAALDPAGTAATHGVYGCPL